MRVAARTVLVEGDPEAPYGMRRDKAREVWSAILRACRVVGVTPTLVWDDPEPGVSRLDHLQRQLSTAAAVILPPYAQIDLIHALAWSVEEARHRFKTDDRRRRRMHPPTIDLVSTRSYRAASRKSRDDPWVAALWSAEPDPYRVVYSTMGGLASDLAGALRLALEAHDRGSTPEAELEIAGAIRVVDKRLLDLLAANPEAMHKLSPRQLEELVADLLLNEGWEVELTAKTRDGGYDLFAVRLGSGSEPPSTWVVECKRYRPERKVGLELVRAVYGTEPVRAGANAMIATTSAFTAGALAYKASRYDLELRDYNDLVDWLERRVSGFAGTNLLPKLRA
jgi:hypothetical protein